MARTMTLTVVAVVAILACCLLAAESAAQVEEGKAAGAKKGSAPKEGSAEKAESGLGDVTVESLIAAAKKTMAEVKDVSAKVKASGTQGSGTGTMKAIRPDYVAMDIVSKTKDQDGKEKILTSMRYRQIKKVIYMEMTGEGVRRSTVIKVDLDELAKLKDPSGMVSEMAKKIKRPDFTNVLEDAKDNGVQYKAIKADGDLVTLEAAKIQKTPMGDVPTRSVITISKKDGLLRSMKEYGPGGDLASDFEFSDYKFNTGLKPEDFAYTPPPGVPVQDFVQMIKQMQEMMQPPQE